MKQAIVVRSPAKVNWILRVGPLREDGYHGVHTALLALDWCDQLEVRLDASLPPGQGVLHVEGPAASADIPTDERNLIVRAWLALPEPIQERLRAWPSGWQVRLHKRIPSQAGLGGGSSNAAAVLAALWALGDWPRERSLWEPSLMALGSDCAFFGHLLLASQEAGAPAAWMIDRGQRWVQWLQPERDDLHLSVITPDVTCATGAVYSAFDRGARAPIGSERWQAEDWQRRENALQEAALASQPELVRWAQWLQDLAPGAYQLAGSGSSFYAPVPTSQDPERWHHRVLEGLRAAGGTVRAAWWGQPFRATS